MQNRFMKFISSANQVILFFAVIVIGGVYFYEVVLWDIFREQIPSVPDGVKIHQADEAISEPSKPTYRKIFDRRLNDVFIFKIESDAINPDSKRKTGFKGEVKFKAPSLKYAYRYRSDRTVNILFVPENSEGYALFENDCLITEVEFVRTHEEQKWTHDLKLNLYCVVNSDTNNDGFLGKDDRQDIYASEYNGKNLILIMKNILDYSLTGNNEVLLIQENENDQLFYIYSVESGEIKKLKSQI